MVTKKPLNYTAKPKVRESQRLGSPKKVEAAKKEVKK
jgi:hypothetical protein